MEAVASSVAVPQLGVAFDPGTAYTIELSFKDAYQAQYTAVLPTTYSVVIPVAFITFSTNGEGKSAAFGAEALEYSQLDQADTADSNGGPGRLDIKMNTYFAGKVIGLPVDGTTIQYNANNELEVVPGSVSVSSYEETTGGNAFSLYGSTPSSWPSGGNYDFSFTPGQQDPQQSYGYGWKQRKWKDSPDATGGRLEQWLWFWTNFNGTEWWFTYAMPHNFSQYDQNVVAFNSKPNFMPNVTGVTPNGGSYRYGFTGIQSLGAGDTFTSTTHVSVKDKYLFQIYFDGYWGTTS